MENKPLPGMEDRGIQEIDMAAEALKETRTQRISLLAEEITLADTLLALMHTHKRTRYVYNGYDVSVVAGKEKVRVRRQKERKERKPGKGAKETE